jgi:hypothetical protein
MDGVTSRYTSFGVDDLWHYVQASLLFNCVLRLGNQIICGALMRTTCATSGSKCNDKNQMFPISRTSQLRPMLGQKIEYKHVGPPSVRHQT